MPAGGWSVACCVMAALTHYLYLSVSSLLSFLIFSIAASDIRVKSSLLASLYKAQLAFCDILSCAVALTSEYGKKGENKYSSRLLYISIYGVLMQSLSRTRYSLPGFISPTKDILIERISRKIRLATSTLIVLPTSSCPPLYTLSILTHCVAHAKLYWSPLSQVTLNMYSLSSPVSLIFFMVLSKSSSGRIPTLYSSMISSLKSSK